MITRLPTTALISGESLGAKATGPAAGGLPATPDRSNILTEQRNPRSMNLHALTIAEIVALISVAPGPDNESGDIGGMLFQPDAQNLQRPGGIAGTAISFGQGREG